MAISLMAEISILDTLSEIPSGAGGFMGLLYSGGKVAQRGRSGDHIGLANISATLV